MEDFSLIYKTSLKYGIVLNCKILLGHILTSVEGIFTFVTSVLMLNVIANMTLFIWMNHGYQLALE